MDNPTEIHEWPFPLRGLNRSMAYSQQMEGTSPDLANVRAFDIVEDAGEPERRARGGQRGGYEALSSVTGDVEDVKVLHTMQGLFLCILTSNPDRVWISNADDPTIMNEHDLGDLPTYVQLVPYKGRLYLNTGEEVTVDQIDSEAPPPPEEGATEITDWNGLASMANDGSYYLGNDLNSDTTGNGDHASDTANAGQGWDPIMDFKGTFDGQNHSISDLHIHREQENVGLFGTLTENAEIKWAHVNGNVNAGDLYKVGILFGYSVVPEGGQHINIHHCTTSGTVSGSSRVGGIGGRVIRTKIAYCSSSASVNSFSNAGGFCGHLRWDSEISNCYFNGNIDASETVGGLVGYLTGAGIRNSYSTGEISPASHSGGLVGSVGSGPEFDDNNFWLSGSVAEDNSGVGMSRTREQLRSFSMYDTANWSISKAEDFDAEDPTDWHIRDGEDYPKLSFQTVIPEIPEGVRGGMVWTDTAGWNQWIPNVGTIPTYGDASCVFRQRIVYASGRQWVMSRVDDPNDWDLGSTDAMASVGRSGVGDTITAVAPIRDDYMVIGCKTSLYLMVGDPMAGGSIEDVSDSVGVYSRTSWCLDSGNTLFFTNGHDIYMFNTQEGLQNLSRDVVPDILGDYPKTSKIDMSFDPKQHGIYIVQSYDGTPSKSRGFFVDLRTQGVFPDTYETFIERTVFFDSEDSNTRGRLEIGDGDIIWQQDDADDDMQAAIDSYVLYTPKYIGRSPIHRGQLMSIILDLDANSAMVDWEIMTGNTIQEAVNASATQSGSTYKSYRQQVLRHSIRAAAACLKIESKGNRWAIEKVITESKQAGK